MPIRASSRIPHFGSARFVQCCIKPFAKYFFMQITIAYALLASITTAINVTGQEALPSVTVSLSFYGPL